MKKYKSYFFKSATKKKLFSLYLIICLPLVFFILLGSEYGKQHLRHQSIQSNHNTLSLQLATVDNSLDHISNYLASFLLDEKNYASLFDNQDTSLKQLAILNDFTNYLGTYSSCANLFFYIPQKDILILQTANYDSYYERVEMRKYIRQACRNRSFPAETPKINGWSFLRLGQNSYLLELLEYQNVYVGAFAGGKYVFSDFENLTTNINGALFLSNQDAAYDQLFGDTSLTSKNSIEISVDSPKNHYRITLYIPTSDVLGVFSWFQPIILLLTAVTLLFVIVMLLITWNQMIAPVLRIIHAMEAVEQGDFNSHLPIPDTGDEFAVLTKTFNDMIRQIHDLKLQIYEEKLNHVYAELQYLTLQIKPHFFLNCLNLIYSLGLSGRSELIVDFSATLMKYFRYLFKSSETMIELSEELVHIKDYLHIQQIRYQNDLQATFTIDKETESMQIPVLTLHTFVENIFKHGYQDSSLMIRISANPMILYDQLYLSLIIEDNGKGFSKELLKTLAENETSSQNTNEKHIGIRNIKQRFSYIYKNDYTLTFENRPEGGARIRLLLPQKEDIPASGIQTTSTQQK